MAINFNNIGSNQVKADSSAKAHGQNSSERGSISSSPEMSESVRFSETAQQLSSLADSIRGSDTIDQERVDSIRNAIAKGQYHIDPQRLASNIVDLELEFNN